MDLRFTLDLMSVQGRHLRLEVKLEGEAAAGAAVRALKDDRRRAHAELLVERKVVQAPAAIAGGRRRRRRIGVGRRRRRPRPQLLRAMARHHQRPRRAAHPACVHTAAAVNAVARRLTAQTADGAPRVVAVAQL